MSGDIDQNPGPRRTSWENVSICQWNLNSIPAHNYTKYHFFKLIFQLISLLPTLTFTPQCNLVMKCGVHSSLHHHQLVNLKYTIHLHMSVKSGIIKKETAIWLEKQSIVSNNKSNSLILEYMKKLLYSIKQLKI